MEKMQLSIQPLRLFRDEAVRKAVPCLTALRGDGATVRSSADFHPDPCLPPTDPTYPHCSTKDIVSTCRSSARLPPGSSPPLLRTSLSLSRQTAFLRVFSVVSFATRALIKPLSLSSLPYPRASLLLDHLYTLFSSWSALLPQTTTRSSSSVAARRVSPSPTCSTTDSPMLERGLEMETSLSLM
jgi:hypothetical protein